MCGTDGLERVYYTFFLLENNTSFVSRGGKIPWIPGWANKATNRKDKGHPDDYQTPNKRTSETFLRLVGWYRRFVPHFYTLAAPLTEISQ